MEILGLPGFETDCSENISNSLSLACGRKRSVCAPSHSTEGDKRIQRRCDPGYCGIQSCRENKRLNRAICSCLSERDASERTQSQRTQEKVDRMSGMGVGVDFRFSLVAPEC